MPDEPTIDQVATRDSIVSEIKAMPPELQVRIFAVAMEITNIVEKHGQIGVDALALVGSMISAEVQLKQKDNK